MFHYLPSELRPDLLGINSMNPFDSHDSSSRRQMHASHLTQMLTLKKGDIKRIQSGMEREYGKYTFSVKMPADAKVLKIVHRYQKTMGFGSIKKNPEIVIIYEEVATKRIGVLSLVEYFSNHQYFGFRYVATKALEMLSIGSFIAKDTILLDSPAIDRQGNYNYGLELKTAFMTHPGTAEDGIVISKSVAKRLQFETYETRTVEWGAKNFPLNLYGDSENFKAFPDIGELVREDGILIALREYVDGLGVVGQSVRGMQRVDHSFDRKVYATGGGEIVDIKIHHDQSGDNDDPAFSIDNQAQKYYHSKRQFHSEINAFWKNICREKGGNPLVTPKFKNLLVEGMVELDNDKQRIEKVYRNSKIDTWRVTFVIKNTITPTTGFKITDQSGGKGVVVFVEEDKNMPKDKHGNYADIIIDPLSIPSRMNLGRLYQHYFNSASASITYDIRKMLNVSESSTEQEITALLNNTSKELLEKAWMYLTEYYVKVSSRMHEYFGPYLSTIDDSVSFKHLVDVCKNGIYLNISTDNERDPVPTIIDIEERFKPLYGPVTYVDYCGNTVTTKENVRIASMYIILLEKIADDWMAVGTGKRQHYGVVAPNTNADKYSNPTKQQAVRGLGEAEVRIILSYAGEKAVVELLDRNNSANTHKHMLKNIFKSKRPTNIDKIVNREEVPYGGSKPLAYINHIMACGGIKFTHKPYEYFNGGTNAGN